MKDDRNYKGYGNNDSNFYWPNKSKLALQFVLNYEEGAENSIMNGDEGSETFLSEIINAKQIIGARNMNMESIYEYGSRRGFWRIHNEFEKRKLPLTIFGVGMALEKNPDVCEQIIKSKYEVASHGYRWIDYQNITEEVENRIYKYQTAYLTGSLIRELVNSVLLEHGHEEYRHKLARVGLPTFEVQEMISNAENQELNQIV